MRNRTMLPVLINTIIFIALSSLHFYWAFGGTLWLSEVLPTNTSGTNKFTPGIIATLVVAFVFMLFAFITLGSQGLCDPHIKRKYFSYGVLIIAFLFLARAIGDLKFVGFFKTIRSTQFAVNDTQVFSPLCLFISLCSLAIFIVGRKRSNHL